MEGYGRVRNSYPAPPGPSDAKLVAMMIEYRAGERVTIATRIAVLLEGIWVRNPERDSHPPLTRAVRFNVNRG